MPIVFVLKILTTDLIIDKMTVMSIATVQQKTLSRVVLQYNEEKLQMSREAATTQRQSED